MACRAYRPAQGHDLYLSRLAGPELIATLSRRAPLPPARAADLAQVLADARFDWAHQYQLVELTPEIIEDAMRLAEQYRLRGADAVHLAAAGAVRDTLAATGLTGLTFVSADGEQLAAAQAEGLAVDNPNLH